MRAYVYERTNLKASKDLWRKCSSSMTKSIQGHCKTISPFASLSGCTISFFIILSLRRRQISNNITQNVLIIVGFSRNIDRLVGQRLSIERIAQRYSKKGKAI